jgi:hypothetical protein
LELKDLISTSVFDPRLSEAEVTALLVRELSPTEDGARPKVGTDAVRQWRSLLGYRVVDPVLLAHAPARLLGSCPDLITARDVPALIERLGVRDCAALLADLPMARSREALTRLWDLGSTEVRLLVLAIEDLPEHPLDWLTQMTHGLGARAVLDFFDTLSWNPTLALEATVRDGDTKSLRARWYASDRFGRRLSAAGTIHLAALHEPATALDMLKYFARTDIDSLKLMGWPVGALRACEDQDVRDDLEDFLASHKAFLGEPGTSLTPEGMSANLAHAKDSGLEALLASNLDLQAASDLVRLTGGDPLVASRVLDANRDLWVDVLGRNEPATTEAPSLVLEASARRDCSLNDLLERTSGRAAVVLANLVAFSHLSDTDLLELDVAHLEHLAAPEQARVAELIMRAAVPGSNAADVVATLLPTYSGSLAELLATASELS